MTNKAKTGILWICSAAILIAFNGCGSKPAASKNTDPTSSCPTTVAVSGPPAAVGVYINNFGMANSFQIVATNEPSCGVTSEPDCSAPTVTGVNAVALTLHALDANGAPTQITAGTYPITVVDPNNTASNPNQPGQKWAEGTFTGFSSPTTQPATQGNVTISSVVLQDPNVPTPSPDSIGGNLSVTAPDGNTLMLPLDKATFCPAEEIVHPVG